MIPYEIDFLPVGDGERSGDAIALRYQMGLGYVIHVVDGGTQQTGEALCAHIRQYYGNPAFIDNVVLTHMDNDHSSGLRTVLREFQVGALWMHRPWLYAAELLNSFADQRFTVEGLRRRLREDFPIVAELEAIAVERRIPIREPFAGERIGAFQILSPTRNRYLELVPQFSRTPAAANPLAQPPRLGLFANLLIEAASWVGESWGVETLTEHGVTSPSNESSVVQIADFSGAATGQSNVLLTADAGLDALRRAALLGSAFGYTLPGLRFMQVPHHGSRRNVSPSILNAWIGQPLRQGESRDLSAYVSAAKEDTTHPRKKVVNAFIRRGARVFATKGETQSFRQGMPGRQGWVDAVRLEFSAQVEA
jgi:beta-lactamase superfamily II metal-dependent hydrolase